MIILISAILGLLLFCIDDCLFDLGLSRFGKMGIGMLTMTPVLGVIAMIICMIFQSVAASPTEKDPDFLDPRIRNTKLNHWLFNTVNWEFIPDEKTFKS